jgi:hypothetical protein
MLAQIGAAIFSPSRICCLEPCRTQRNWQMRFVSASMGRCRVGVRSRSRAEDMVSKDEVRKESRCEPARELTADDFSSLAHVG